MTKWMISNLITRKYGLFSNYIKSLGFLGKRNNNLFVNRKRRASPFVEEAGLILIALFFFIVLYSVFGNILDSFFAIIEEILGGFADFS